MPREKFPETPGIDPGTFRLLEQCLNHYATPGPAYSRGAQTTQYSGSHLPILDMNQVPYCGPTNIWRNRTEVSSLDDLAPGICTPLA